VERGTGWVDVEGRVRDEGMEEWRRWAQALSSVGMGRSVGKVVSVGGMGK